MDISIRSTAETTVIALRGPVHHGDAERFRGEFERLLDAGQRQFVVDYSGLTYIDSTLIAETIGAFQRAAEQAGSLKVVSPPGTRVRDALQVTGVDRAIEICDSLPA